MGKWPYAPAAPSLPPCELARAASWEGAGRAVLPADSPRNQSAAEDSKIKAATVQKILCRQTLLSGILPFAMPSSSTKTRRVVVMGGSPRLFCSGTCVHRTGPSHTCETYQDASPDLELV